MLRNSGGAGRTNHARDIARARPVFDHFREALLEVGVQADKVAKVVKLLESRRNTVLNP